MKAGSTGAGPTHLMPRFAPEISRPHCMVGSYFTVQCSTPFAGFGWSFHDFAQDSGFNALSWSRVVYCLNPDIYMRKAISRVTLPFQSFHCSLEDGQMLCQEVLTGISTKPSTEAQGYAALHNPIQLVTWRTSPAPPLKTPARLDAGDTGWCILVYPWNRGVLETVARTRI